ncbi:MAG: NUDIX hydrolase [bacterium]|nr:NUDIX hydrolase [bacterium]
MQPSIRIRVAVILIQNGTLLFVKHCKYGKEYWLLPGGGLEFGETIESCAKRELREETGFEIELGDLAFINESIPPDKHRHVLNLFFWGTIIGGTLNVQPDGVLIDAAFIPIEKIPELTMFPRVNRELLTLIQRKSVEQISLGNRWD